MGIDFNKFARDNMADIRRELKKMQQEDDNLPSGVYEVTMRSVDVDISKTSAKLMLKIALDVQGAINEVKCEDGSIDDQNTGKYKNRIIFLNYFLENNYGLFNAIKMLNSLGSAVDMRVDIDKFDNIFECVSTSANEIYKAVKDDFGYKVRVTYNKNGYIQCYVDYPYDYR